MTLTKEWKRYTIDCEGKDMSRIKTGFVVIAEGAAGPIRVYFDDVRFE